MNGDLLNMVPGTSGTGEFQFPIMYSGNSKWSPQCFSAVALDMPLLHSVVNASRC